MLKCLTEKIEDSFAVEPFCGEHIALSGLAVPYYGIFDYLNLFVDFLPCNLKLLFVIVAV